MKNLAIFILLVVFVTENIFSYDQKTKTINYNIKKNVSKEYTGPPNFYSYGFNADHDIGYWVPEETEYVSGYSFPLNTLPPEEYIISCKLEIIFDEIWGSSFRAYVKELPNTAFSSDASEVFDEIKNADDFFYFDYPDTANRDITSKVIDNISTGFIKFGLAPINQYQFSNLAEIKSIKIVVKYYDYAEFTVDNNFSASDGIHGEVKIDGSKETAPYEVSKKTGVSITLQAISPQTDNQGYQMLWHTGSTNPSDWRRDDIRQTTNISYTFTTSTSDHNTTYKAHLRKVITTTSGTLSQNETWFTNVTLTGNIFVPSGVTLTIESGSTVNYGQYGIILNGGSITIENGVTKNYLYVKSGSTLKAIFDSVQIAVDYSSSSQTIELLPSTTYSGNIAVSSTSNRDLNGATNGTSVIDGNITLTNCTDFDLSNLKMHNGHSITINSSSGSDTHFITFMGSGAINQYNGNGNHASGVVHNAASTSAAIYYYNTSGNNWGMDITDHDFGIWATANASMNVSTSTFCDNLLDLYANSGGYIYAPNNTMSAPWPQSIGGNVSGSSNKVCSKQLSKSDLLVEGIEDNPLPEEINFLNAEYAKLLKRITDENEDKSPSVLLGYKPEFDALIKIIRQY